MNAVNVAELKNRLSHYLRLVRRGTTFLVRDRDRIVARLEPAGDAPDRADEGEWLSALEREGIVRPGRGRITAALLARRPRVTADVVGVLLAERREGR